LLETNSLFGRFNSLFGRLANLPSARLKKQRVGDRDQAEKTAKTDFCQYFPIDEGNADRSSHGQKPPRIVPSQVPVVGALRNPVTRYRRVVIDKHLAGASAANSLSPATPRLGSGAALRVSGREAW
jgi:hypothetical protein